MRAPSCLLDVLLHAGMSALTRYFPGFGFLLCPGGTPGPELEHTPPSWSVHFVPLGAVHASALGAVAPTNSAAPRTTPRMRFFIRCPPVLRGHLPPPIRPTPPRAYPVVAARNRRARQVRQPRGVGIATRCVVVSVSTARRARHVAQTPGSRYGDDQADERLLRRARPRKPIDSMRVTLRTVSNFDASTLWPPTARSSRSWAR
jgi:hypothetical protein